MWGADWLLFQNRNIKVRIALWKERFVGKAEGIPFGDMLFDCVARGTGHLGLARNPVRSEYKRMVVYN